MSIILELWDIHEQLFIDKKFILKRFFILWISATQFLNSFICISDIIFTDPVQLKE